MVSVWKSIGTVAELVIAWLLYHGTSSHDSLGCRCAKAQRDLPKVQTRGWFKRRGSSPLPWEFCPAEHFKADTSPPASFKSIPVSCHTHCTGITCLAPQGSISGYQLHLASPSSSFFFCIRWIQRFFGTRPAIIFFGCIKRMGWFGPTLGKEQPTVNFAAVSHWLGERFSPLKSS